MPNELTAAECADLLAGIARYFGSPIIEQAIVFAEDVLRKVVAGELQEVVHGEWEEVRDPYGVLSGFIHTDCGRFITEALAFCPTCGAIMDGKKEANKS